MTTALAPKLDVTVNNSCNWKCCKGEPKIKEKKPPYVTASDNAPTRDSETDLTVTTVYHKVHRTSAPHTPQERVITPIPVRRLSVTSESPKEGNACSIA